MSTLNVELLRKTLEHLTAHPDEWNQQVWAKRTTCGTAMCLAGTAVVLAGDEIDWDNAVLMGSDGYILVAECTTTGRMIESRAQELLGLGCAQAGNMFHPDNNLRDLWEQAAELTDGEIVAPDELPDGS